jgi:hypothetical protein
MAGEEMAEAPYFEPPVTATYRDSDVHHVCDSAGNYFDIEDESPDHRYITIATGHGPVTLDRLGAMAWGPDGEASHG